MGENGMGGGKIRHVFSIVKMLKNINDATKNLLYLSIC